MGNIKPKYRKSGRGRVGKVLPELNRSIVAREIGVTRAHLSKVLSGKAEPSLIVLRELARVTRLNLTELNELIMKPRHNNKRVK